MNLLLRQYVAARNLLARDEDGAINLVTVLVVLGIILVIILILAYTDINVKDETP